MEPPTTPIGRDELALRRHRFFSDLLNAAHAAVEHRVRFDPLGPIVAKEEEDEVYPGSDASNCETLFSWMLLCFVHSLGNILLIIFSPSSFFLLLNFAFVITCSKLCYRNVVPLLYAIFSHDAIIRSINSTFIIKHTNHIGIYTAI